MKLIIYFFFLNAALVQSLRLQFESNNVALATEEPKVLVSVATIPKRCSTDKIEKVISSLIKQSKKPDIVLVNIPEHFKKLSNMTAEQEKACLSFENKFKADGVVLYRNKEDYGPATKLLGAMEFLQSYEPWKNDKVAIVNVDDDHTYHPKTVANLLFKAQQLPEAGVVTHMGETWLKAKKHAGRFVNGSVKVSTPMGYCGALYWKDALEKTELFSLRNQLPAHIADKAFGADDDYFAAVLGKSNVTVFQVDPEVSLLDQKQDACPDPPMCKLCWCIDNHELMSKHDGHGRTYQGGQKARQAAQQEIYRYFIGQGWIPRI